MGVNYACMLIVLMAKSVPRPQFAAHVSICVIHFALARNLRQQALDVGYRLLSFPYPVPSPVMMMLAAISGSDPV